MHRIVILLCLGCVFAAPKTRVTQAERKPLITMNLPANWTNIRDEIADTFACDGRGYGYYADVDNDCQVFHVCLPIEGRNITYKWSFICPGETIFNQESFTCTRLEDSIKCDEAPDFYKLNDNFGQTDEGEEDDTPENRNRIDSHARNADQGDNQRNSRRG